MSRFAIGPTDFELDGQPVRLLSGALHYFRVHPDQWADRIHKARLMGLDTIETYVAWNAHAPRRDTFDTSGGLDLGAFLDLVAAEGMQAIVRPGPYICAEWDNGGLPAWLFQDPQVGVRRSEPGYLAAVDEYLRQVYDIVAPRQIDRDGPVILVQIENEYGAYGDDADYLRHLVELTRSCGITVPLTTVDQPTDEMLAAGSLPELHRTGSFGGRVTERLETLRRHQPTGPLMCSEFWNGWFDHWGEHHHTTSVTESAAQLDALLASGASVNLYMFHGGTNFGFTNGANDKGTYRSHVTSYDYDAPLDETGHPTEKYFAFREVIARYTEVPAEVPPAASPAPGFRIAFSTVCPLTTVLPDPTSWRSVAALPTMDDLDHYTGFTWYRTELDRTGGDGVLSFTEVRDRAQVFIDGQPVGVLQREQHERALRLPPGQVLDLLVEDQGRVNYGPRLGEPKGLIGPALLDGEELTGWRVLPLHLDEAVASLTRTAPAEDAAGTPPTSGMTLAGPVLAHARFTLERPTDLHLDTSSWGKGVVWVNGFILGRYWARGPQHTLYVPGEQLRAGNNDLVVLETGVATGADVRFVAERNLGPIEH